MKRGLTVVFDEVSKVIEGITLLASTRVLVGIPAEKAAREDGTPINNAQLAYIHDKGAPEANIPARPFMEPGIESVQPKIEDRLHKTAVAASEGRVEAALRGFAQAGMIAASGIKAKIVAGPFVPLKPATIEARRRRSKGSKYRRKAVTAADVRPLNDTGQMRNAVNYVVKKV